MVDIVILLDEHHSHATFLAGGTAAVAYVFVELQGSIGGAAPGNLSAYDYFLTQLRVIVHYIRMLFLPVNLNFAHDVRPSTSVIEWSVVASGLVLLAIACLAWYLRKRSPVVSFSIFWFFITLAPTSSIVSVLDVIFEHRLYLPLVGVCLSFPLLLIWIQRRSPMLTPARCGAAIVLILAAGTIVRNQVWADEVTLWSDTIAKSPGLARGYRGLAQAYYSRGAYDKAVEASKEGIQKTSGAESTFYGNMGQFYLLLGRYDEALDAFSKATQFHATTGEDARAYYNMGVTHLYKQEFPAAEQAFVKSLELDPNYLSAWDSYISLNLDAGKQQSLRDQMQGMLKNGPNAKAYYGLAKVALLESNYNDAVNFFTQSRPAYGNEKMFLFNYAMALESAGDAAGAIDRYNEALRIDPQFMQAHFNLAQIYFDRGRFTAAIPHFEQVLKIDPRNTPAHIQLARIFIQQGQRVLARNHLSAVLNMSPGNAEAAALWPQTL